MAVLPVPPKLPLYLQCMPFGSRSGAIGIWGRSKRNRGGEEGEGFGSLIGRNTKHIIITLPKILIDKEINKVILDASKVSIMLLFIIANAMLFAHVLTTERIPHHIAEMIVQWGLEPWMFLIVVNILLLIAGNFMEPSAIILIMAPILFPIALKLGIDPIHLGIIMVVNMEIGMLTPPVGLNLFVISGVTGRSMGWAIKACFPGCGSSYLSCSYHLCPADFTLSAGISR